MLRTARSFRHALIRPAAAFAAGTVLASGLVLGSTAPVAASTASTTAAGTTLSITPYRQTRYVNQRASFTVTLTSNGTKLANQPVTFWTRPVTSSTWTKYVTRNTNTYGNTALAFYVRSSTYVRATFAGTSAYAPTGSVTAGVTASTDPGPRYVTEASRHAGKPYQWGAAGPYRFDCSGFTMYVFGRFGKKLPHNSRQQYSVVQKIAKANVRVGDLIFTGSSPSTIGHVGIYAGNGEIWHSPRSGTVVKRSRIWSSSYFVGRVV